MSNFRTTSHAKCILTGEHAVLRNHPAIVFPINYKDLRLFYGEEGDFQKIDFDVSDEKTLLMFFNHTLAQAMKLLGKDYAECNGKFILKNSIPMGAGMGFSAALCVIVTQWLIWKGWLNEQALFNFARNLEDMFHGKSSGVDIAGAMTNTALIFRMNGELKPVKLNWQPYLYLSFAEKICPTRECVNTVNQLWLTDKSKAEFIDSKMAESTQLAEKALLMNKTDGLHALADALDIAKECFDAWGLISPFLKTHINNLLTKGALSAKPTGSGNGGYVLSLWQQPPDFAALPYTLIPVSPRLTPIT